MTAPISNINIPGRVARSAIIEGTQPPGQAFGKIADPDTVKKIVEVALVRFEDQGKKSGKGDPKALQKEIETVAAHACGTGWVLDSTREALAAKLTVAYKGALTGARYQDIRAGIQNTRLEKEQRAADRERRVWTQKIEECLRPSVSEGVGSINAAIYVSDGPSFRSADELKDAYQKAKADGMEVLQENIRKVDSSIAREEASRPHYENPEGYVPGENRSNVVEQNRERAEAHDLSQGNRLSTLYAQRDALREHPHYAQLGDFKKLQERYNVLCYAEKELARPAQ